MLYRNMKLFAFLSSVEIFDYVWYVYTNQQK